MQHQAKYVARKIEDMRGKLTVKKRDKESLLLDVSQEDDVKIALFEEKQQEIVRKIRQLQNESMLKGKVTLEKFTWMFVSSLKLEYVSSVKY
jgi:hypothetical protein